MRLRYNFDRVRVDAESIWGENTAIKMTADHFRQLEFIRWIESNIGEMYEPVAGNMLHGIGWYIDAEFSPGRRHERRHYLDIDDGAITEQQVTEFLLRFG